MFARIHVDPATLLLLPFLPDTLREPFVANVAHLTRSLFRMGGSLRLVLSREHWNELMQQLWNCREFCGGRGKDVRELLLRYLGSFPVDYHEYGDACIDAAIVEGLSGKWLAGDSDIVIAWGDLLSSPLLVVADRTVPGYSHKDYRLLDGSVLRVRIGELDKEFSFSSEIDDLVGRLGLIDPAVAGSLEVHEEPYFRWEDTGHGSTRVHEKIVVRTARRSGIVVRSGTTYQNPEGGAIQASISPTADVAEFMFTVCDHDNVLKGIFRTRATTQKQSDAALVILRKSLQDVLRIY